MFRLIKWAGGAAVAAVVLGLLVLGTDCCSYATSAFRLTAAAEVPIATCGSLRPTP